LNYFFTFKNLNKEFDEEERMRKIKKIKSKNIYFTDAKMLLDEVHGSSTASFISAVT
jgi:hypothetical protein